MPQILKMISEIKVVRTEGLEITGTEFKEMIITDICRFKVQTNITVALALMFRYFFLLSCLLICPHLNINMLYLYIINIIFYFYIW